MVLASIIIFTPLRYYLPGYGGIGERMEIIQKSIQVDSLLHQMELQGKYLEVVKSIVSGELTYDSVAVNDTLSYKERAELLVEKSKAEKDFVSRYERDEKYNLSSLAAAENSRVLVFFKPTKGVISSPFDLQNKSYGISILTSPHETVVSVLSGTVIHTSYSFNHGGTIIIQHEENYISVYKQNSQILKKMGDSVKAGEVIAFTDDENGSGAKEHFQFELWKQGAPINPEELILF